MQAALKPTDFLQDIDFAKHNEASRKAWDDLNRGEPSATPVIAGANTRFYIQYHPDTWKGFEKYINDPDEMFDRQLEFQRWSRHNLMQSGELGLPDHWHVTVDFQNFYEAGWFGCPIEYLGEEVPDTQPIFEHCPEKLIEAGIPDPFGGLMARAVEYLERFEERAKTEQYLGLPIHVGAPCCGIETDGPMTVACNLFGAHVVCELMAAEPERLETLLAFITEASITRIRAWRSKYGIAIPSTYYGIADDSIALISTPMYREHILPHHKKLFAAFSIGGPHAIHLCGNATRHFRTIVDELNVKCFDTGFPVDHGKLREELGNDVTIMGGPHVQLLRTATPEGVRSECQRILESGILKGGRFVLRDGNNLAPGTPLENLKAMYDAAQEFGLQGSGSRFLS